MDAGPTDPREFPLRRLFPWLRLARAVGASLDAKKLILAAVGLVLMKAGWAVIDRFLPAPDAWEWESPTNAVGGALGPLQPLLDAGWLDAGPVASPARSLMAPFASMFSLGVSTRSFLHAALSAVWGVLVWGTFGGAIARIAAVQAAGDERLGLASAFRFALGRKWALIGTPLSPLIGVGFLATLCAGFGLLYQIPGPIGATLAGLLAPIPLLLGLVMALILVGLGLGWPLMVATVAAEGEDGFDALSRSYGYVSQRPGHYAFYALVAWLQGVVGLVIVSFFAGLTVRLAIWGLSIGGPDARLLALFAGDSSVAGSAPAVVHEFWLSVVGYLAQGWVFSYFWTAAALIYLLLRRDVDGTPWHDIGAPEHEADAPAARPAAEPRPIGDETS